MSIFVLLISCNTIVEKNRLKAVDDSKTDIPRIEEVIAGENTNSGKPVHSYEFRYAGDYCVFKKGEVIQIVTAGIDFSNHTFSYKSEKNSDSVKMTLEPINNCEVELTKKCDVVLWYDPMNVPNIKLAPDMAQEQIVITPLFNDDCERIGYQIRYGAEERGCRAQAVEVLRDLEKCSPYRKIRIFPENPDAKSKIFPKIKKIK